MLCKAFLTEPCNFQFDLLRNAVCIPNQVFFVISPIASAHQRGNFASITTQGRTIEQRRRGETSASWKHDCAARKSFSLLPLPCAHFQSYTSPLGHPMVLWSRPFDSMLSFVSVISSLKTWTTKEKLRQKRKSHVNFEMLALHRPMSSSHAAILPCLPALRNPIVST